MKWYKYFPSDTLFLRGSEPMVSGTSYETVQLFPPPVSVIKGALRTAVLAQKHVSIHQYRKGHDIEALIGKYGETAPFKVIGPLLSFKSRLLMPAPYTWFVENPPEAGKESQHPEVHIHETKSLDSEVISGLGLTSSSRLTGWVRHFHEIKPVGGCWVSVAETLKGIRVFVEGETIFSPGNRDVRLFEKEERLGIGMDPFRRVNEGQLYMARHIRLHKDASIVWAVDRDIGLDSEGVLSLGGEQRFGRYCSMDPGFEFQAQGNRYLALSPVEVNETTHAELIASGKIVYRGGWNLARQFHKEMKGYYPAGAVFSAPVDHACIAF
jgi:CRISPR-associated protein Cmr3